MPLNQQERDFIKKRETLIRAWTMVGPLTLLGLLALLATLALQVPVLVNPLTVINQLETGTLPHSTLTLAAVMLPIITLVCMIILFFVITLVYAVMAIEKKYLALISRLLIPHFQRNGTKAPGDSRDADLTRPPSP